MVIRDDQHVMTPTAIVDGIAPVLVPPGILSDTASDVDMISEAPAPPSIPDEVEVMFWER